MDKDLLILITGGNRDLYQHVVCTRSAVAFINVALISVLSVTANHFSLSGLTLGVRLVHALTESGRGKLPRDPGVDSTTGAGQAAVRRLL